nr:hypothetical protein [Streptomyces mashuensis]
MDVIPVQSECLALADAGPYEDLAQVCHEWVGLVAVGEESHCLLWGPDLPFRVRRTGDDRRSCWVVGEAVLADGVAEGAGEGGEDAADGDAAAGELGVGVAGYVPVAELLQPQWPEGWYEIVLDVGAVAHQRRRFEAQGLGLEPVGEVLGDGLVRSAVNPPASPSNSRRRAALAVSLSGKPPRRTVGRSGVGEGRSTARSRCRAHG